jgi:hypothetical protein
MRLPSPRFSIEFNEIMCFSRVKRHPPALRSGRIRSDGARIIRAFWTLPCFFLRRLLKAPGRALAGRPDRLLPHELAGYVSGLRYAKLAFAGHPRARDAARATMHAE